MTLPKAKNSLASKLAKPQKIKCVLAQPFSKYRPVISSENAEILKNIFSKSDWKDKCTIGLRSSLRKSNNSSDFECLLLSTKLKPFFVSWQIIHSVAVREKIPKVFCFPNLEELAFEHFGKKTIAVLIHSNCEDDFKNWLQNIQTQNPIPKHLLPQNSSTTEKTGKTSEFQPTFDLQDLYLNSSEDRSFTPNIIKRKNPLSLEKVDKSWSGDFISFGDVDMKDMDRVDSEEEKDVLQNMLSNISKKSVNKSSKISISHKDPKILETKKSLEPKVITKETSEDEFLEDYIGVTVQKIQKNPDKVKKKKKKGNNKQIKK